MFELLPVHGSFSKPTVTLNILAYSNTSLLTHLTTFNTIPFKLTYILFLFLFIHFLFLLFYLFFIFFLFFFLTLFLTLFRYFIKLFYYTSFPFFKGCRLEKGHICVPIHKKKKIRLGPLKQINWFFPLNLLSQLLKWLDNLIYSLLAGVPCLFSRDKYLGST